MVQKTLVFVMVGAALCGCGNSPEIRANYEDDAECVLAGAAPETATYADCRLRMKALRTTPVTPAAELYAARSS